MANKDATWKTSVTVLMDIFHDALLAMIPIMDRAHLAWKEPDNYDEWDEISETLFKHLVIETIQWAIYPKEDGKLVIPQYGFTFKDYSGYSVIESVQREMQNDRYFVFIAYSTTESPLDTIECLPVDLSGELLSNDTLSVPYKDARFGFRHRLSPNEIVAVSDLRISTQI